MSDQEMLATQLDGDPEAVRVAARWFAELAESVEYFAEWCARKLPVLERHWDDNAARVSLSHLRQGMGSAEEFAAAVEELSKLMDKCADVLESAKPRVGEVATFARSKGLDEVEPGIFRRPQSDDEDLPLDPIHPAEGSSDRRREAYSRMMSSYNEARDMVEDASVPVVECLEELEDRRHSVWGKLFFVFGDFTSGLIGEIATSAYNQGKATRISGVVSKVKYGNVVLSFVGVAVDIHHGKDPVVAIADNGYSYTAGLVAAMAVGFFFGGVVAVMAGIGAAWFVSSFGNVDDIMEQQFKIKSPEEKLFYGSLSGSD